VTTDIELAFEAAFGTGEGIVLLAGTGSAAYGRSHDLRTARAGGRGPWVSDEGGAFDIGRRAFGAIVLAEEHRGPATALSSRIFKWHHARNWDSLLEQIAKNPDDVFPKTFPLVAELADVGDDVARTILLGAAASLAELAAWVANELDWRNHEVAIAKVGGVYGRSKHFDAAIEAALKKVLPRACLISPKVLPAEAAAHIAIRLSQAKGNAA
jgi:N-acetylglucosamine kinase-like BadF-type ATPase